jgi:hypothetical protein
MAIDKKIIEEIKRFRSINKYIMEQDVPPAPEGDVPPPPPGDVPPAPGAPAPAAPPPPPGGAEPQVIDVESDKDVEKIDDKGKSEEGGKDEDTEELDITDLVDSQKNIEKKQEEYFDNLFGQISKLESKLAEMDLVMSKLNSLENKIEKYRDKSPQEKLELRTYDSYPFNQKLSDFFDDKKGEMEKTGKNEYILTTDEITDINPTDVKKTFQPGGDEDENNF